MRAGRFSQRPFGLLLAVWIGIAFTLGIAIAATGSLAGRDWTTEATFFWRQDLPVFVACVVLTAVLGMSAALLRPLAGAERQPGGVWVAALALFCLAAGVVGGSLVFFHYDFSLDEFLADFDARIFASGRLYAPVPPAWRPYTAALQPIYMLPLAPSFWASSYLPINAVIRALASKAGAEGWVNPALSAFSVVAVWAVGRRLWPGQPRLALIAAALLGTSSQLVVMSMTAYAMPAHLAFNLAWLWLFLRGGRLGHAGAILVGFLATGLHELIFHPIFAAPFILELWTRRRWRGAALYSFAYAAICAFWVAYWPVTEHLAGVAASSADSGAGGWLADRICDALDQLSAGDIGVFAQNLVRFATWQNPLAAPLFVAGAIPAFLAKGHLRSLALGVALTLIAAAAAAPSQTHGWGYRYLHGLLGSVSLVGAWAWTRWTGSLDGAAREAATGALAAACAVSLLILTPVRAWQAASYVRPYAAANAAIQSARADVVIVDHDGPATLFDMGTLVRNDPFLARSPKVMALLFLPSPAIRQLCATRSVALFNHESASSFGIDVVPWRGPPGLERRRALMTNLGCGKLILASARVQARRTKLR